MNSKSGYEMAEAEENDNAVDDLDDVGGDDDVDDDGDDVGDGDDDDDDDDAGGDHDSITAMDSDDDTYNVNWALKYL